MPEGNSSQTFQDRSDLLAKVGLVVVVAVVALLVWGVLVYGSAPEETEDISPTPTVGVEPTGVTLQPTIEPTEVPTPTEGEVQEPEEDEEEPTPTPEQTGINAAEIDTVEAVEFDYEPGTEWSASPGDTISFTLENTGTVQHNFVIDSLNVVSSNLQPGESEQVEFTIPEDAQSTYTFYCSIGNHRELGMEGTITVSQ